MFLVFEKRSLFFVALIFGSLFVSGCNAMGKVSSGAAYGDLAFSPDAQTLTFREYRVDGTRGLGFLDLLTGERRFVAAPQGHRFTDPVYSPDGRQIVAALFKSANESQLVIMDVDGQNMREITRGKGCRTDPSFSPDGGRIIFSLSPLPEVHSTKKCVDEDVYELDLATGNQKQLTDFKFYNLTGPEYFPDGKRFIFSGQAPLQPINHREYDEKFGQNFIFIMDGQSNELVPAISGYRYSNYPSISANGIIAFIVVTNRIDKVGGKFNYDLYIRDGGEDRRLTRLKSSILHHTISADGSRIAFMADDDPDRGGNFEMMIMNADGTGLHSLGISGRLF